MNAIKINEPRISIKCSGCMWMNKYCYMQYFSLSRYVYLSLDEDNGLIEVQPVYEQNGVIKQQYVLKYNENYGGAFIEADNFIEEKLFHAKRSYFGQYAPEWISERKIMVLNRKEKVKIYAFPGEGSCSDELKPVSMGVSNPDVEPWRISTSIENLLNSNL